MSRKQILVMSMVLSLLFAMIVPAMAQTSTPTAPPAPTATAVPLTASTNLFLTANFRANVRSGPSIRYTVLGQIRPGDALDITGKSANKAWLRVTFNGQEGWISAGLVKISGDIATAPDAEAGPNAILRESANQAITNELKTVVVITRVNANLRTGASQDSDSLAVIPFSTTLTVIGRTANNNWVRVTFNNQTGWISSGILVFSQGNIANAPVVDDNGNPIQPTPEATKAP